MRASACVTVSQFCARPVLCWLAFPSVPALGSPSSAAGRPVSTAVRKSPKTSGMKFPLFLLLKGAFFCSTRAASILPSRPPNVTAAARRACQGWRRLRGHPSTAGPLIGSGPEALTTSSGISNRWFWVKFTPLVTSAKWSRVTSRLGSARRPPDRPARLSSGASGVPRRSP